eukprot:403342819
MYSFGNITEKDKNQMINVGGRLWKSQYEKPEQIRDLLVNSGMAQNLQSQGALRFHQSGALNNSMSNQTIYEQNDIPLSSVKSSMAFSNQKSIQQDYFQQVYVFLCQRCHKPFKNNQCECPHCENKHTNLMEVVSSVATGYYSDDEIQNLNDQLGNQSQQNPNDSGYFLKDPQFMIEGSNFIESSGNQSDEDYLVGSSDMKQLAIEQKMKQDDASNLKFQFMISCQDNNNNKQEEVKSKLNFMINPRKETGGNDSESQQNDNVDDLEIEKQLRNFLRNGSRVYGSTAGLKAPPNADKPTDVTNLQRQTELNQKLIRTRSNSPQIAILKEIDTSFEMGSQMTTKLSTKFQSSKIDSPDAENKKNFQFNQAQVDEKQCKSFNANLMMSLISQKFNQNKSFYELKVHNNQQNLNSLTFIGGQYSPNQQPQLNIQRQFSSPVQNDHQNQNLSPQNLAVQNKQLMFSISAQETKLTNRQANKNSGFLNVLPQGRRESHSGNRNEGTQISNSITHNILHNRAGGQNLSMQVNQHSGLNLNHHLNQHINQAISPYQYGLELPKK